MKKILVLLGVTMASFVFVVNGAEAQATAARFHTGDRVRTNALTTVYSGATAQTTDYPTGYMDLGTQAVAISGTVAGGGPIWNENHWWQPVLFDIQPGGWVMEDTLTSSTVAAPVAGVSSQYDFGGMTRRTNTCPTGYSSVKGFEGGRDFFGSRYYDDLYFCVRQHTPGSTSLVDFGGMYSTNSNDNAFPAYPNPFTGANSCPASFSASAVLANTVNYAATTYLCSRPHQTTSPYYYFGGLEGYTLSGLPTGYSEARFRSERTGFPGLYLYATSTQPDTLPVLNVSIAGAGSGEVSGGVIYRCGSGVYGSLCSAINPRTSVLTATPRNNSTFSGWSGGACSGTGTCTISNTSTTVTANFSLSGPVGYVTTIKPWTGPTGSVAPNTSFTYTLNWSSTGPMNKYWFAFVHFVKSDNPSISFGDAFYVNPATNSSGWTGNLSTSDSYTFPSNANVPAGVYDVYIGLYDADSRAQNLAVSDGVREDSTNRYRYRVGSLTVGTSPASGTMGSIVVKRVNSDLGLISGTQAKMGGVGPYSNNPWDGGNGSGAVTFPTGSQTVYATNLTGYDESVASCTYSGTTECTASSYSNANCDGVWCSLPVSIVSNQTVKVVFKYTTTPIVVSTPAQSTLNLTKDGTGSGTATITAAGNAVSSCITAESSTCSTTVNNGSVVTLNVVPSPGSTFGGWTGGGCSGTWRTCTVTINAATTVVATFNPVAATGPLTTVLPWTGPSNDTVVAGTSFDYALKWSSTGPMNQYWFAFVHFVKTDNPNIVYGDSFYPDPQTNSSSWNGNITTRDSFTFPKDASPGTYKVLAGLYNAAPRAQDLLTNGVTEDPSNRYSYQVGTITVTGDSAQTPTGWNAWNSFKDAIRR